MHPASGMTQQIATSVLDVGYLEAGPADGPAVLLLHGWPDDVRGWRTVAPPLNAAGFRTLTPYLRGCGSTRFLSAATQRDGRGVALAQDAIDLMDALHIERFAVVGHDWGARAAYTLAALWPHRVTHIAALGLAYQPHGANVLPPFSQARQFWYQWFMTLDQGADAVRQDPRGFARIQWDTWSPPGWFDDAGFDETAASFDDRAWADITLNAYRSRWQLTPAEPVDPRYDALQNRLAAVDTLATPTLMIQGGDDRCDEPSSSADQAQYFSGPYDRVVLDGIGHFPAREAPAAVADAVLAHLRAR
jgi:pimeloyl-ACP methyl ester carboxylesterase